MCEMSAFVQIVQVLICLVVTTFQILDRRSCRINHGKVYASSNIILHFSSSPKDMFGQERIYASIAVRKRINMGWYWKKWTLFSRFVQQYYSISSL